MTTIRTTDPPFGQSAQPSPVRGDDGDPRAWIAAPEAKRQPDRTAIRRPEAVVARTAAHGPEWSPPPDSPRRTARPHDRQIARTETRGTTAFRPNDHDWELRLEREGLRLRVRPGRCNRSDGDRSDHKDDAARERNGASSRQHRPLVSTLFAIPTSLSVLPLSASSTGLLGSPFTRSATRLFEMHLAELAVASRCQYPPSLQQGGGARRRR